MKELEYHVNGYRADTRTRDETLFHCANGYLGVRGSFEEGCPEGAVSIRGTYVNGFCEDEDICYGERLYGFPATKQVMVNLPDAQGVRLFACGRMADCWSAEAKDVTRTLDLGAGLLKRTFRWKTQQGTLRVSVTRMASFVRRELFLLRYEITSEDFSGEIRLDSTLDGGVHNFCDPGDPRVASETEQKFTVTDRLLEKGCLGLLAVTLRSRRQIACTALHELPGEVPQMLSDGDELKASYTRALGLGETLTLNKYCIYTDAAEPENLLLHAYALARDACDRGFAFWRDGQRAFLDAFWARSRVRVEGDGQTQAYLDFCQYEMLCAAGQNGRSSVAAKGLSGEGYEGHYFWDCETYVFPFFLATAPDMARKLLDYRYGHLDGARAHAREMGHTRGVLFPWRTITGSECSSYYPSGSAQYHINADIAHAFCQYWYATRDESYLPVVCEVLVETARLFLNAGHMLGGRFCIDGVTGPDEYTCIVDNNYYTNAGAAYTFFNAAALCGELERLGGFEALSKKTDVTWAELSDFEAAGENMYLPYDETLGICEQDDSFLKKKRWNIGDIPPDMFPLLLHYHPLYINRHQICKQADTVLAHFIFREEPSLTMARTYCYYEKITTHDSSLSACVYSIMAARLGDLERAMRYFQMTVGVDMQDRSGNTRDGLHAANMGGAYLSVVAGFGGLRISQEGTSLFPLLPAGWSGYSFPLMVKGGRVLVSVDFEGCTLRLLQGSSAKMTVYNRSMLVTKQEVCIRRPVRGVIFDLDGVVTDTAKYHFAAWKRVAGELGIPFDEQKNERFKGVSRAKCMDILLEGGGLSIPPEEKQAWMDRKNAYYREMLEELSPRDILPGIPACMEELERKGIPFALFSVSKNTDFILQKLGLKDAFGAVVTGLDISHSKPHFEGYLLAADRLGVDHRLCLMIEDAQEGLNGARALSMRTVGIGENLASGSADALVRGTELLPECVRRFL